MCLDCYGRCRGWAEPLPYWKPELTTLNWCNTQYKFHEDNGLSSHVLHIPWFISGAVCVWLVISRLAAWGCINIILPAYIPHSCGFFHFHPSSGQPDQHLYLNVSSERRTSVVSARGSDRERNMTYGIQFNVAIILWIIIIYIIRVPPSDKRMCMHGILEHRTMFWVSVIYGLLF